MITGLVDALRSGAWLTAERRRIYPLIVLALTLLISVYWVATSPRLIDREGSPIGTDFTNADQLLFDQVIADGKADETVRQRAEANSFENFALSMKDQITGLMIDRMDKNEKIVSKFLDEDEFKDLVTQHIARKIYEGLMKAG